MKKKPNFLPTAMHIALLFMAFILFLLTKGSPLLGTLGFESANLFAVIFGPWLLLTASLNTQAKKDFSAVFLRELLWGFLTLAVISTALFINGFFLTSCSLGAGVGPFLVIIAPVFLLNITLGSLLSPLISSRRLKLLIVVGCYLLYYFWVIFSWWQHGTFRVLTHASFLMSSDLVTGDYLSVAVIGFRVATLFMALALIFFGTFLMPTKKTAPLKKPMLLFSVLFLIAHFGLDHMSMKALGKDRTDLINDYSALIEKDNIKVFFDPLNLSKAQAEAILREALYYKDKFQKQLGPLKKQPITIWLHQNEEDKFAYTGAKNVHFALPKHREIHISSCEVPHGVLGHELAHIIIGEFSNSLLGCPSANGLIPNLALTEGLAVALTEELNVEDDLTLLEQAQGLYQAQIEVDFFKLFSSNPIHFAMINPKVSYIYAGGLVKLALSGGQNSIKEMAQTGRITKNDPKDFFNNAIKKLKAPVAPYALSFARNNFSSLGIITSDCSPSWVNQRNRFKRALLNKETNEALAIIELLPKDAQGAFLQEAIEQTIKNGLYREALPLIDRALTKDQKDFSLKLKKLQSLASTGNYFAAQIVLKDMDLEQYAPGVRRYLIAMDIILSALLAGEEMAISQAIVNYFMSDGEPLKMVYIAFDLNPPATMITTIGQYLLARFEMSAKSFAEAVVSLDMVLEKKLLPPLLEQQAQILRIKALIELKEEPKAKNAFNQLSNLSPADHLAISELFNRLTFNHKLRLH